MLFPDYEYLKKFPKKCIVNADLDGILSGLILEKYFGWEVAGYNHCSGKDGDSIWFFDDKVKYLSDYTFVDLHSPRSDTFSIDQHYVSFNDRSNAQYLSRGSCFNPNIFSGLSAFSDNPQMTYTHKFPLGTFQYLLAAAEAYGFLKEQLPWGFDLEITEQNKCSHFKVADLVLRADGILDNSVKYYDNVRYWLNELDVAGGQNTRWLNEFIRKHMDGESRDNEKGRVEDVLRGFTGTKDGDFRGLIQAEEDEDITKAFNGKILKQYYSLNIDAYFEFLVKNLWFLIKEDSFLFKPVKRLYKVPLSGYRTSLEKEDILKMVKDPMLFSFAIVSTRCISVSNLDPENLYLGVKENASGGFGLEYAVVPGEPDCIFLEKGLSCYGEIG